MSSPAWTVSVECVNVAETTTGAAAFVIGEVVRSSGFAPAEGSRGGFVVWDNTPGGLPDGVGILGPEVPAECNEIEPLGRFTKATSGDVRIR